MKIKSMLPLILSLFILCVGFAWQGQAARPDAPLQQWEYKRVYLSSPNEKRADVDRRLNEIGAEGWELVAYYPNSGDIVYGLYIFKRQK